jgi:thiamine biosynthesis lipoprotein
MRLVLEEAHRVSVASGGAFDATVQPLWRLIADRLSRSEAISPQALDSARRLVAFDCIDCRSDTVMLARPGMAVTLNGIAQGYITDRVADLLHDLGFDRVLVQLGESMALAPPAEKRAWQIAVPDPRDSGRDLWTLALSHRAVATSSGLALKFDAGGRRHHLLDPRTGDSPNHHLSVTVLAARAMRADALSTALFVLPSDAAAGALAALGGGTALILHADGRTTRLDVGRGAA